MNEKKAKQLRRDARRAMKKSPKLTGFTAHSTPVLRDAKDLGISFKGARRAMRLACEKLGKAIPGWAQRLIRPKFGKDFVRVEA